MVTKEIEKLIKEKSGIRLDLGCGSDKQDGCVGMDVRELPGVDIVHNLEIFPWPLPDECVTMAYASHLVEHISPNGGDARIQPLVDLLVKNGILTNEDVREKIGDLSTHSRFIGFMNELWRVMKPDGRVMIATPYGGGPAYLQDPTHINPCSEHTWCYFDPLDPKTQGKLYHVYKPKPWRIDFRAFTRTGNMEVVLVKRRDDPSYYA
jgi:hypothetical protein